MGTKVNICLPRIYFSCYACFCAQGRDSAVACGNQGKNIVASRLFFLYACFCAQGLDSAVACGKQGKNIVASYLFFSATPVSVRKGGIPQWCVGSKVRISLPRI